MNPKILKIFDSTDLDSMIFEREYLYLKIEPLIDFQLKITARFSGIYQIRKKKIIAPPDF